MQLFATLLAKLIPLYAIILLGYVAGTKLEVRKEGIARLLIYVIAPLVIFHGVYTTPLTAQTLSLPVLFFVLCCATCAFALFLGRLVWSDATKNIVAFTSGTGNTGYFGLPVALALFGEEALGPMVLSILGFVLFENSVGFFVTARGRHTAGESIRKVLRLPTIYAFFLAAGIQAMGWDLGEGYAAAAQNFRGAYTVLGMMIIGLGIADLPRLSIDGRVLGVTFFMKFLLWPAIVLGIVALDRSFLGLWPESIHAVMLLLSIVPLASNTVAVATELKVHPEKAAMAVLLSTLAALFIIPLFSTLFLIQP